MAKKLAVLDFDHTVVEGNTDVVVANLLDTSITDTVKYLYKTDGWTSYMQAIFTLLHTHKITQAEITKTINNIPCVQGFPDLIKELKDKLNYDIVIISDSNSYFIDCWLQANSLKNYVLRTFTNPARFVDEMLKIDMYHLQDYCTLSTKNLCKGQIMMDFQEEQRANGVLYERIVYIGDGKNDFCPLLRLKAGDVACVRKDFKCAELVALAQNGDYRDESGLPYEIKADVVVWRDGLDILNVLRTK